MIRLVTSAPFVGIAVSLAVLTCAGAYAIAIDDMDALVVVGRMAACYVAGMASGIALARSAP